MIDTDLSPVTARPVKRSRQMSPDIKALRMIVRGFNVLEDQTSNAPLEAALRYVVDRYSRGRFELTWKDPLS